VYAENYSENIETAAEEPTMHEEKKAEATVEQRAATPTQQNNATPTPVASPSKEENLSPQSSLARISKKDSFSKTSRMTTPSPPLSRGSNSRSSQKSQKSRPEDELTVLSAEEVVEVDSAIVPKQQHSKSAKLLIKEPDVEVYGGRPRPEYNPPRAFARHPSMQDSDDDEDGLNKGCYYFMSCLDAFWIL
jgi:hypothetical protein